MEGPDAPGGSIAAVDAANFALEGAQPNVVALAGLLAPGGFVDERGVPDVERLRRVLADRVRAAPALCRRPVPAGSTWRWEPALPELGRHVRLWQADAERPDAGSAPPPFEQVCARTLMTPLPLDRPLWELLLVPGAVGMPCGVLFRLHHALADGLEAEALVAALCDGDGEPEAGGFGSETADARRLAPAPPADRRSALARLREAGAQTVAVFRRTVRSRVLLGPLGPTRDVAFLDVGLADLHDGAKHAGGTVGDAFLTAFGQGLRAVLEAAHETLPETLPVSSPVRLPRRAGEGNATGVMLVHVPVADADAAAGVARVAAETRSEKARARAAGTFAWMASPRSAALLMRFARTQRAVAAIASEFPGPSRTLRLDGSELVSAWPLSLLSANVRVGAVGASYAGRFRVSVQTDAEHVAPARLVADAMATAFEAIARR
ncbi:wax ester/triacylglycerol synthase domain-containing protein [Leifsonia sp. EB34]|uniref:wax ester/triacylglycerol synthase domain-containing protein n=1 Tax=Leifsonia sp. EB34 TaxID=3156303 RepID=UPI0035152018